MQLKLTRWFFHRYRMVDELPFSTAANAAEKSVSNDDGVGLPEVCVTLLVSGSVLLRHASAMATTSASPVLAAKQPCR